MRTKVGSNVLVRFFQYVGVMLLAVPANICLAQSSAVVPLDWKSDCVGRMQLSFPSEPEVAANAFEMLESEYKVRTQQPRFTFSDGQNADYSSQQFLGSVLISHSLTAAQRSTLLAQARNGVQLAKSYVATTKNDRSGKPLIFEELSVDPWQGYAVRVNNTLDFTVAVSTHVIRSNSRNTEADSSWIRTSFDLKIRGLAARSIGQLPNEKGICLPYTFFRDDGEQKRSIGATYRLKNSPDVTIWLEDSSPEGPTPDRDESKLSPQYQTNFFWRQRYQDPKRLEWIWNRPRAVKLDGREGVASFVELTRTDNTIDYGYLAVVRGDPQAKVDTPDLMLYVIRDAKNAIAKGKKPIEKDEFLKIAEAIAASVKHRPAQ